MPYVKMFRNTVPRKIQNHVSYYSGCCNNDDDIIIIIIICTVLSDGGNYLSLYSPDQWQSYV
jgi:hypothetical protein